MASTEIEGMRELQAQLRRLEKFPKKSITKAAREGINPILAQAKANAPKESGALKRGIKKKLEKSKKNPKGKSVYRLVFDPKMNPIFQKPITPEGQGTRGAKPKKPTGYYPVSQEFGFKTSIDGDKEEGKEFIQKAFASGEADSARKIVRTLNKEIDKLLQ